MPAGVGLGVRLEKATGKPWPTLVWAAADDDGVVGHGIVDAPRTYSEAAALRHLCEALMAAVTESRATTAFVWTIERNARPNNTMRPRLRLEGAACVAAVAAGASVQLGAWSEVASLANVPLGSKASYAAASEVCGIPVGDADSYAVLAAVAARGG